MTITDDTVSNIATGMGIAVCESVLYPALDQMPEGVHALLFERFMCAIAGAACGQIGPERTKAALDAVKLAIDDVQATRRKTH